MKVLFSHDLKLVYRFVPTERNSPTLNLYIGEALFNREINFATETY